MDNTILNKPPLYKTFIFSHEWHFRIVGILIGIFMITLYLWMITGFINLILNLYHSSTSNRSHGAEIMIKDTVIVLASLELVRVFQTYLLMGRVKVTFIPDVALVVLIGELISLWYRDYSVSDIFMNVFVITALVILRIITTKFSPDCNKP